MSELTRFEDLLGHTLVGIKNDNDEMLVFTLADGSEYRLYHQQDCCENVYIEDIIGDLTDLLNSPILMAEEVTSEDHPEDKQDKQTYGESFTWTFYKLATVKGYVTIRWYESSNGYYSERVTFARW